VILTLDLGTSATKAALWSGDELVALGRGPIETEHPQPGWAEQDPVGWWSSVVQACARARAAAPGEYERVEAIGFSAARETFTLVDGSLEPLRTGIVWSDGRAHAEAEELVERWGSAERARARTGVVLNAATCAAKVTWVARHQPEVMRRARWILAPRDLVVARLTGEVVTDPSLASRTGAYALDGSWIPGATELVGERLPPVRPSVSVVGVVLREPAGELGLPGRTVPVVIGAGDRACEVLGAGASTAAPMVSWGTTTNVSVPLAVDAAALPTMAAVSFGALGGYVLEAGLSASGAALAWLASLTRRPYGELLEGAAHVPPGADGLVALPWLHGARAPWWRPEARAAFTGLSGGHGPAELARAVVEAVALDVARCLELVAPEARELALAGGGAESALWREVLAAVTARPLARRRLDEAASVGARIVVGAALGEPVALDAVNPVVERMEPDAGLVERYREVRVISDAAAAAVLSSGG
jgi:xylulokinase